MIINQAYLTPYIFPPYNLSPTPTWEIYGPTSKLVLPGDYDPRTAGQCVIYVQFVTGKYYSGNAENWDIYINSDKPTVGSIVVLDTGWWGHIGVVIKVDKDIFTVRSRNWRELWVVSDDVFNVNDERIIGYII